VRLGAFCWIAILQWVCFASACAEPATRTVTVGPRYGASALHALMLGRSYRALWTTPIQVEVLDLAHEAGGLTPVRRVGGQQTLGLALRGADGRAYTFRSLDKEPSRMVPEGLRGTFVADLVQDQMAAQHPAAALVAEPLSRAAGVPCVPIRFVMMPDDSALGEFRADFAGVAGTFSEFPTAATSDREGFEGALEIVDHAKLHARIAAGPGDRVAAGEYLDARLFDLLLSDFDRHRRQWRWARREGDPRWHPIPEDRDQAFARYEGVLVRAARGSVQHICAFGPRYDDVVRLTWNGREQDRWLLPELSRDAWVEAAGRLQARITDPVIEDAARRMPPPWFAVDGDRLAAAMRARRDALPGEVARFYRLLAREVDVQCTDDRDLVRVRRDRGDVEVQVSRLAGPDSGLAPYFTRRFVRGETREVRVYLRGGDDRLVSEGRGGSITVRVIGGPGNDEVVAPDGGLHVYDAEGEDHVSIGRGTKCDRRPYTPAPGPPTSPWIPPRDWGSSAGTTPWFALGSDLGVFVGGGIEITRYGFRRDPFAERHTLRGGWASGPDRPRYEYEGLLHHVNSAATTRIVARYSELEGLGYHGVGNGSRVAADADSNELHERRLDLSIEWRVPFSRRFEFGLAPRVRRVETPAGHRLIDAERPYGSGRFVEAGLWAHVGMTSVAMPGRAAGPDREGPGSGDSATRPRRDFSIEADAAAYPRVGDVETAYGWLEGRATTHLGVDRGGSAMVALHGSARRMLGDRYPYFAAASTGGGGLTPDQDAVRGLPPDRFRGDGVLRLNADLRLDLSRIAMPLPVAFGVVLFQDVGRVWLEGEHVDRWHGSWGAGPWIGVPSREHPTVLTFARSENRTAYQLRTGFSF